MVEDSLLEELKLADQRAIRTIDSLTDAEWAQMSMLPGWTRSHVVAHLALNAEAFAGALDGVQDGVERPVYASAHDRERAIEVLAAAEPTEIRDRYFTATSRLRHTFGALTRTQWERSVSRVPGGPIWPVEILPVLRQREVEIHHADLGCAYTAADWPEKFTVGLLELAAENHRDSPRTPPLAIVATDLQRSWSLGAESPVVSGTAATLAWWLIGRGAGEGLDSGSDPRPTLGPWTRG